MGAAKAAYARWFPSSDHTVIDAVLGAALSNRRSSGPPVWLIVISGASQGKTTALEPLYDLPGSYLTSGLTDHTLVSGLRPEDAEGKVAPSLLNHLEALFPDVNPLLLVKDFGSIVSMAPNPKRALFGQLREIYDGDVNKPFGTGARVEWHGKLGLLGASTRSLDKEYVLIAALGQRFLFYRRPRLTLLEEKLAMARQAIDDCGQEEKARQELGPLFTAALDHALDPDTVVFPASARETLAAIAVAAEQWRTPTERDRQGELYYDPDPGGPARIAKELLGLTTGVAAVYGRREVGPYELKLAQRVARDSLPELRVRILDVMASRPGWWKTTELMGALQAATERKERRLRYILDDLQSQYIGVVESSGGSKGRGNETTWRIVPHYADPLVGKWQS